MKGGYRLVVEEKKQKGKTLFERILDESYCLGKLDEYQKMEMEIMTVSGMTLEDIKQKFIQGYTLTAPVYKSLSDIGKEIEKTNMSGKSEKRKREERLWEYKAQLREWERSEPCILHVCKWLKWKKSKPVLKRR